MTKIRGYIFAALLTVVAACSGDVSDALSNRDPFGTIEIFEGKLYIQTGKSKNVSKQIQKNGKVQLCAMNKAGNKWLRLSGTLVRDDRREPKVHMLEAYPELKRMYSPDDENTEVLYFKDATATFYSFTEAPRVVKF